MEAHQVGRTKEHPGADLVRIGIVYTFDEPTERNIQKNPGNVYPSTLRGNQRN